MVRRYTQLIEEVKTQQKFTKTDWTKKILDALTYTLQELQEKGADTRLVTYEEWRLWQEQLAKKQGWQENYDRARARHHNNNNRGFKKVEEVSEIEE